MKHRLSSLVAVILLCGTTLLGAVACSESGNTAETTGADTTVETPADTAPETNAPETNAPETNAPETNAPETNAPETNAPETNAPETDPPETNAPETEPEEEIVWWNQNKDVVVQLSFDELRLSTGGGVFEPGASATWNSVAEVDETVTAVSFWGWVAIYGDIGSFGYQIDANAPVYDASFAHVTEQAVLDAALSTGATNASRMLINIDVSSLGGSHTVRTFYTDADGKTVILGEFELIRTLPEPEPTNIALGKFVSSNNSLEGLGFFGAAELVDGIFDDDFGQVYDGANTPLGWHNDTTKAGQSSPSNPSYIDFDLDGMHRISSVKLIPMAFYHTGGSIVPRDFTIEISKDGANWTVIQTVTDASCQWNVDEPLLYEFDPVETAYVRINITKDSAFNGGYTTLGEVEIYGIPLTGGGTTEPDYDPDAIPDVSVSDLDMLMQNIFAGNEVRNETVMFIEKTDVKTLLYPIDTVISVTSFDCKTVYEEGKDYIVENGKLKLTPNTSIPVITAAKYYNVSDAMLQTNYNGKPVNTHWGEARAMIDWQVNINYTHTETWGGYTQPCESDVYDSFIKKLEAGEDVTVFFYGDSITYGANATWLSGYRPNQYPYTILFTEALADLYDYTVHYERGTANVPSKDYVAGKRGTITYVNTAVGGWTSQHGVENLKASVTDRVEKLGCDLFVVAFGMNDAGVAPATTKSNIQKIVDGVLSKDADASIVLLSTMVPNPNATNGWYGNQSKQEAQLLTLAESYRSKNVSCAVARMTSVSLAVLEHKEFHDYSGNNINHPNDFFIRVYAQTLLQTVIGYENLN